MAVLRVRAAARVVVRGVALGSDVEGDVVAYRCRNYRLCRNHYTEVIGVGWEKSTGADCLPCFHAASIRSAGLTPEHVEAQPRLFQEMVEHLAKGGWSWDDLNRSFSLGVSLS